MVRGHTILAVYLRNLAGYFSGLLGYVVIVTFVVIAAALAFSAEFFASNHATLDQLTNSFPALLVFLIPALTMTSWSDEKKLGTDELLFTMPATDFEILIGKYFSVLSVYTIALLFSCTNLLMLMRIGNPDPGVQFTTYVGYWLAGAALISAGMLASALTSNAAVAFVVGAVFCCIPVFISMVANVVTSGFAALLRTFQVPAETVSRYVPESGLMASFTVGHHLEDFALGILPLEGAVYFIALSVFFLYLNYVVISRRHWNTGEKGNSMGWQFLARSVSLAAIVISVTSLAMGSVARFDFTEKDLFTLSPTTKRVIAEVDPQRPVQIQAYVSPRVPEEYVAVHQNLIGMLREFEHRGGSKINVRMVSVEPYSEEADEARYLGIEPRSVQTEREGEIKVEDVFLGARVSSGYDEVIIPFFEVGNSVEYELTRSIRTVSEKERLTVGILETDANVMGGVDSGSFRSMPEWQIVTELKKQYEVESVSPDSEIPTDKFDVLLAIMPSSLTQPQLTNLVSYVEAGHPTLIFDDPLPVYNGGQGLQTAPRQEKPRQGGMFSQAPPPEPKADNGQLTSLLNVLQIAWDNGQVVFDIDNPHPRFADAIRPELIFITPRDNVPNAFNPDSPITSGLQEMLLFFSGTVRPLEESEVTVTPLLRTGATNSGLLGWNDLVRADPFFGPRLLQDPRRLEDEYAHVVAVHVESTEEANKSETAPRINTIFVSDADMVSDDIFRIAEQQLFDLQIDNIKFVLNCVDTLAGEEDFIDLRKRRDEARTLTLVESLTTNSVDRRTEAVRVAQERADEELKRVRTELDEQIQQIQQNKSLDEQSKARQIRMAELAQEKKLEAFEQEVNRETEQEIKTIKATSEREISAVKGQIRFWAIVLPPLPAILLGLILGLSRASRERQNIAEDRLLK